MRRIALVSCVKSKRQIDSPARDLYDSPLFRGLRSYALSHADEWYILSARYGLLSPEQVVAPYELTLNNMRKAERLEWANRVTTQLAEAIPGEAEIIMLAGTRYRELIEPFLRRRGHRVLIPMEGMTFGRQLAWLKAQNSKPHVD